MNRSIKFIALFVAIACSVWVVVLWRWQVTARDMNTRDIVVYLGLLPIAIFVFALLARWAWRGMAERDAQSAAVSAAAETAVAPIAATADEATRHATVQLLAAHVLTAAAAAPDELQAAARAGSPRPMLDPDLHDDDDLPLLTARIASLDLAALEAQLEPHARALRDKHPEAPEPIAQVHVLRALAALREPLERSAQALAPWAARFVPQAPHGAPRGIERRVRVLLGWPVGWSAAEQELGRLLVTEWLLAATAGSIPHALFALTAQTGGGDELLLQADRLMQTLAREGRDDPLIVAACHSAIGEAAVAALERAGLLFASHKRPKGQMPAEAAAALLLAPADWPADPQADGAVPHLHRPALLRRDKSIDAPGRVSPQTALQAMSQALAASRLGADAIGGLISDAGRHTERSAEFFGAGATLLPQLDAGTDLCGLGGVTGAVGAVGALLAVACAARAAQANERPVLALALGDPYARLALVALPGAPASVAADAQRAP